MVQLTQSRGYAALKRLAAAVGYHTYFPETEWLSRLREDVFFVQIGAHDGKTNDHIYPLALARGWHGLAVEPIPNLHHRLESNYRGTNVKAVNVAIGLEDGRVVFYSVKHDDDPLLPKWYDQIGSFRRDVILSHASVIPDIADRIVPIGVDCLTLPALLKRYCVQAIDLLLIDTEGYDLVVLQQVDFDRYRPRLIIYERKHLNPDDERRAEIILNEAGYAVHQCGANAVATPALWHKITSFRHANRHRKGTLDRRRKGPPAEGLSR